MNSMLSKEQILDATNGGLDVFEFFIKGFPGPNKAFLNPFYDDNNPSMYVYKGLGESTYRFIDFGNDSYHGDCFNYVALVFGKDTSNTNDFKSILSTINHELSLSLETLNQNPEKKK